MHTTAHREKEANDLEEVVLAVHEALSGPIQSEGPVRMSQLYSTSSLLPHAPS